MRGFVPLILLALAMLDVIGIGVTIILIALTIMSNVMIASVWADPEAQKKERPNVRK